MLATVRHRSSSTLIEYRPPFDWPALLGYFVSRATPGVEVVQGGEYWRSVRSGAQVGVVGVSHDPDKRALRVRVSPSLASARAHVNASMRRVFDLDCEPTPMVDHLKRDAHLAPLVRQRPGLRVPGAVDGFELAIRAILGQQVSVRGATTLAGRLAATFGEPIATPLKLPLTHVAPSAERLADAGVDRIAAIGLPRARAATLVHLARAVADGAIDLLTPGADRGRIARRLLELPGIGPWTVEYISLRALRDADAFPDSDLGLRRAMGGVSAIELRGAAERWRPWRGYAAIHLWTSLTRSQT
jgi:AraC family transcriptional regulator, regulatory protein of adaptative response / DNA-3-methyladenine glycosylase II